MKIIHISAECYPMAKVGGLGDVVGALPKYLTSIGATSLVVVPMHKTNYLVTHEWKVVHKGIFMLYNYTYHFTIIREKSNSCCFELYCVDVHGILDRQRIYGYEDDFFRFLVFQVAVLQWINSFEQLPDVIHLHDHHTGLMPFMMKYCYAFTRLQYLKTVFTIHNAAYQGIMDPEHYHLLPAFDDWKTGLLLWNNQINSLACAVKCADRITTVSQGYLSELFYNGYGLEQLFQQEQQKCKGILNGIDDEVWNPASDGMIAVKYDQGIADWGKYANKMHVCKAFGLNTELPLFVFIGRLVREKAADLLSLALRETYRLFPEKFSCIVLGNGEPVFEDELIKMNEQYPGFYHAQINYDEAFSHQLYASADFLLMPSRTEPCGLNQLYAMRYGTIPVVSSVGGLKDTVVDIRKENGFGICFDELCIDEIANAVGRAIELYQDNKQVTTIRKHMMNINHSWHKSANEYVDIYRSLIRTS